MTDVNAMNYPVIFHRFGIKVAYNLCFKNVLLNKNDQLSNGSPC